MFYEHQIIFTNGTLGYNTYRIPVLLVTSEGTILAFCEGRRGSASDIGPIDILLRRSYDYGQTWTDQEVVVDGHGDTAGNPAPVVDRATGDVVLVFCRNPAASSYPRTVFVTRSSDDGATWADPVEITSSVKFENWRWYATGPVHGIQSTSGRLIIPCDHTIEFKAEQYFSHIIYSDDGGFTWSIGGVTPPGANECTVVQLPDGAICLNARNVVGQRCRYVCFSYDDGETLVDGRWDRELVEPECQGSLIGYEFGDPPLVFFSNPASRHFRLHMTVRASADGCETWPRRKTVYEGSSAYSDLAVLPNGRICLMYERGTSLTNTLNLAFDVFDLEWFFDEQPVGLASTSQGYLSILERKRAIPGVG